MATTRPPAGLFDLPLELRQLIYTEILPTPRLVRYPLSKFENASEKTALAVCATHPVLHREMGGWLYKCCGARLHVTPDKEMNLPKDVTWGRFRFIEIEIDYMSTYRSPYDEGRFVGVEQAISSLLHDQPTQLPEILILFHEDDNPYRGNMLFSDDADNAYACTDWYVDIPVGSTGSWTTTRRCSFQDNVYPYDSEDEEEFRFMFTRERDDGLITCMKTDVCHDAIAVLVLEHFLQLPPCMSATVLPPRRLEWDPYDSGERVRKRYFDKDYGMATTTALELWLGGKREGFTLSNDRDEYGRGALEQLAYTPTGEWDFYSDSASVCLLDKKYLE